MPVTLTANETATYTTYKILLHEIQHGTKGDNSDAQVRVYYAKGTVAAGDFTASETKSVVYGSAVYASMLAVLQGASANVGAALKKYWYEKLQMDGHIPAGTIA